MAAHQVLLKLYLFGYMYRIRSCRRLERECHKNTEVLWLLSRLTPDFKTIANLRVDNRDALLITNAAWPSTSQRRKLPLEDAGISVE